MSRAFVKENDLEHAGTDLPERPQSPHPNYVTPQGLQLLQRRAETLEQEYHALSPDKDDPVIRQRLAVVERDLRYFQARLESAIPVDPAQQSTETILFGAIVTVEDENGEAQQFAIVGEDEADISQHKIGWTSPLAHALLNHRIGDTVTWLRPAGNIELEITDIRY